LEILAGRSTIPVALHVATNRRYAEPIEVAAYFVASEALANATKHAQASVIEVSLAEDCGKLMLAVQDDGIGGADSRQGSGLVGLRDRVEALTVRISVDSPQGGGTSIAITLPLEVDRLHEE
jgi:signal transduction histidine kinase